MYQSQPDARVVVKRQWAFVVWEKFSFLFCCALLLSQGEIMDCHVCMEWRRKSNKKSRGAKSSEYPSRRVSALLAGFQ